jgi:hypothetical protein
MLGDRMNDGTHSNRQDDQRIRVTMMISKPHATMLKKQDQRPKTELALTKSSLGSLLASRHVHQNEVQCDQKMEYSCEGTYRTCSIISFIHKN